MTHLLSAKHHVPTKTPICTAWHRPDLEREAARKALVPLHRISDPDADIAGIVSFLISPDAGYITGQNILADGGLMDIVHWLIPGRPATER